jgi:ABC-type branched-subunit amino acid transport system substrate-binding protein
VVSALVALLVGALGCPLVSHAQTLPEKIGAAVSLQGSSFAEVFGRPEFDGVRLAVEEANAGGELPRIEIQAYDDQSKGERAGELARDVVSSDALVVVGPMNTASVFAAAPVYGEAGLVSLVPTAVPDVAVKRNQTTFTTLFSTGEGAEWIANFLRHILGGKRAIVLFRDDGYGRPFAAGFKGAAERLGIAATARSFSTTAEAEEAARQAAADPEHPAIVLGMLADDAKAVLVTLRRQGAHGPILGSNPIAGDSFVALFRDQPEERRTPGYFTEGVYAVSPSMLDSANAETLAFANRFRARYGYEPTWIAVQGYDTTRLAVAAVRATHVSRGEASPDLKARREAIRTYLASIDSLEQAAAGLTGPIWFTADRGRQVVPRLGRFHQGRFESAPVQLVPVSSADRGKIASGALLDVGSGRFARRQQVVYTGVFLNEIARVDIAQSTFTADLYLWVRFARDLGSGAADPTDIDFPDLVRGSFDAKRPAEQGDLDDGTTYRLWRVRGDFKNDFDLHRYPFDHQTLALSFFNARAASDRLVYVQDRWSVPARVKPAVADADDGTGTASGAARAIPAIQAGANVAPAAFRNLTQWETLDVSERRDILVTESALGNPRLVGVERVRELSGFNLTIELRRRVIATLAKTLLPLCLMALILYASLYFPVPLVKEKVTVAVTAALSGAVLLSSINSQLGNIGYVIAVEYVFYLFFALCLLCIVSVLAGERLRVAGRQPQAVLVEQSARYLYLLGLVVVAGAAWLTYVRW